MKYTTLVPASILRSNLDNPAWVILDCRFRLDKPMAGRQMYNHSHLPGALYADLNNDLSGKPTGETGRHPLPDIELFRAKLGNWGIQKGVQVVCYDDLGGAFAARLWWMLRYLGHEVVAVLDGGWQDWVAQQYPLSSKEESSWPATFEGTPDDKMLATLSEVVKLSAQGEGYKLVDARDAARYRGEFEPIDRVPGHIPGARNRPFVQNLTQTGMMRSPKELQQAWQPFLAESDSHDLIMYCGSGVSACHNLLALEQAGHQGARLFVPSWSGWSASPERPVERTGG